MSELQASDSQRGAANPLPAWVERALLLDLEVSHNGKILKQGEGKPVGEKRRNGRVKWPDVEAPAKRIFGDRVLPNLVLLERQEETI